ncbi:hypothetical protein [Pseudomonas protegens]|jgi:hypothetical protein|uniref:Uncharacterized protein n=1 Tax=Pseudomonas protegens TaxID=380021 RepID=A0ABY2VKM5_9PSED|nr:hypothetical protein [Pseudomonas protegens]QIC32674.1 hypothetical protein FQ342_30855 [Pseudomonas protegens]TMM65904.1 hypothetical protein FEF10_00160 [Pseudomonas protegens]URN90863.1 MAG: hypothetical protein NAG77_08305 [Pseudomonas protegens]WEK22955.1 MAG: hypothetical protein P0Y61_22160 [Pseudomonas protegens]
MQDPIQTIREILISAARDRKTVSYPEIYNVFKTGTPKNEVWDTFEEACRGICDSKTAIYGALLSKKDTGLPESGFFDIYKNMRGAHYRAIAGNVEANVLTGAHKKLFCDTERSTVYQHVLTIS